MTWLAYHENMLQSALFALRKLLTRMKKQVGDDEVVARWPIFMEENSENFDKFLIALILSLVFLSADKIRRTFSTRCLSRVVRRGPASTTQVCMLATAVSHNDRPKQNEKKKKEKKRIERKQERRPKRSIYWDMRYWWFIYEVFFALFFRSLALPTVVIIISVVIVVARNFTICCNSFILSFFVIARIRNCCNLCQFAYNFISFHCFFWLLIDTSIRVTVRKMCRDWSSRRLT